MSNSHSSSAPLTLKNSPMDKPTHQYEAPEVDPRYSPPVATSPSLFQPESFYGASYGTSKPEDEKYFSYMESPGARQSSFASFPNEAAFAAHQDLGEKQGEKRRYCGMRKPVFFVLLAVILLLVIAGVVLGVVFGVVLPKQNTSSNVTVVSKTGLATAIAADDSGKLYTYFQNPDGEVHEISYRHGVWSQQDDGFVTKAAAQRSPLAAISYRYNGDTYRQVFFFDSAGSVTTMNRTETRGWDSPRKIRNYFSAVNSIALAACVDYKLKVILVFYGSQYRGIKAVGGFLDGSAWFHSWNFYGSDPHSGVACSTHPNVINVYLRTKKTSRVQQYFFPGHRSNEWSYSDAPTSWANHSMAEGSDIAVCDDGQDTEYVFYQLEGGLLTRGVVRPAGVNFETIENVRGTQGATMRSKLAASYVDGGSLLMYQRQSDDSEVWTVGTSRDGLPISSGVIST